MMAIIHRVTIVRTGFSQRQLSVNDEIKWLCSSLGLFSLRDKDSSCYRVFIELLKNSKANKTLASDEIAHNLELSRGTVMHHVKRLIESGLVVSEKGKYKLRVESLETLMRELERDVDRTFQDMREIAKKIDRELEL